MRFRSWSTGLSHAATLVASEFKLDSVRPDTAYLLNPKFYHLSPTVSICRVVICIFIVSLVVTLFVTKGWTENSIVFQTFFNILPTHFGLQPGIVLATLHLMDGAGTTPGPMSLG